jgi:hypothetical protein
MGSEGVARRTKLVTDEGCLECPRTQLEVWK